MLDGSDAVSDWPLLNLMVNTFTHSTSNKSPSIFTFLDLTLVILQANTAGGATWVSFHHGGGVGIGITLPLFVRF